MTGTSNATVDITGHDQHKAWIDKRMPSVERVRPGLWSIPIPMPNNGIRYVLIYALELPDGIALIDVGWDSEESWSALVDGLRHIGRTVADVRYVAVTHLHPDHFGLVPRLLTHTDATVAMHAADAAQLEYRDDAAESALNDTAYEQLRTLGAPTAVLASRPFHTVRLPYGRTIDVALDDGQDLELPGWSIRTVWTPGHTAGHLCFLDEVTGVLFSGDHLLPRVSPNISTVPGGLRSPLRHYLTSLENTVDVPDVEVLPSHEYRFRGLADRARALLSHHEERMHEIVEAITAVPGATSWDVTTRLSWSRPFAEMPVELRRLALREVHSHILLLAERGVVATSRPPTGPGRPFSWTRIDDEQNFSSVLLDNTPRSHT